MSGTHQVAIQLHSVVPIRTHVFASKSTLIEPSVFLTSEVRMFLIFVSQMAGTENSTKVD
jgi:hypothetical protein